MFRFSSLFSLSWKQYAVIAVAVIAVGFVYLKTRPAPSPYESVVLKAAPMEQIVSVTGKVQAQESVDLAFSVSGRVVSVDARVGQAVAAGQSLVRLESSDLSAQLAQAQAQADSALATLDGLRVGAQPSDIAASQAAVDKARQDLANMYAGISDTLSDGLAKGTDAVRTQLNGVFSNADGTNPQLTYSTSNSQSATDAATERVLSGTALNDWQLELAAISPSSGIATLEAAIANGIAHLAVMRTLIQDVNATLNSGTNLSAATLADYKTSAATALSEINTAISNLNGTSQSIASQKITVQQLQSQLELKRAGSTPQAIAAQEATVNAARANVQVIQAQLGKTVLRAPFSGLVTRQDAKAGAAVSSNTTLVSVSSQGSYEIETYVPEADIAKVAMGNPARVTLDAYGDTVPFVATVLSIDPAETVLEGVSTYKVALSIGESKEPVKSGMTANVDIVTATRDSAISVPARAVYQNSGKSYIKMLLANGTTAEREVTTGIQGADGSLELLSGVKEGENVVTYTTR
ncbi:MAG: efflux RND transporter periplasmic adaptor subunit [Patescibacteria group bacterium]